jgi:hypothetical protein
VYERGEVEILRDPEQFEAKPRKLLDKASQETMKSIVGRLKSEIIFMH